MILMNVKLQSGQDQSIATDDFGGQGSAFWAGPIIDARFAVAQTIPTVDPQRLIFNR
ncbi:MAG: hypothetical protein HW380_1266 [Magnetococcales bacterium]|nr:hypothetical protein [Magnetococcales bacterium]